MKKAQLLLASRLLSLASNSFANHGCNDMSAEMFEGISSRALNKLEADFNRWNQSSGRDYCRWEQIGDSSWMEYLAQRLEAK